MKYFKEKIEYRKKNIRHIFAMVLIAIFAVVSVAGCSFGDDGQDAQDGITNVGTNADTGFVVYGPGSYDSADTPVLVSKDEEAGTLTFLNLTLGKTYTLEYDGTTCFYDKYDNPLALSQVNVGAIVDVKFVKTKKHLANMKLSESGWVINDNDKYIIDEVKRDITIGEDVYKISSDVCIFSNGKQIELRDIIATDILTFSGIGTTVYSINVEKGHGYLRLKGYENFVDGWIEIGKSIIERVTEDMLITVPEGTYKVTISNRGTTAEKQVVINRNSESSLDFSDVEFLDPKTGLILFSITPKDAAIFIDGAKVDTSEAVPLTYGIHQIMCKATGYTTITQYINVGTPSAGFDIELEKSTTDSSDTGSSDSGSAETGSDTGSGSGSGTGSGGSGTTGSGGTATGSDGTGEGDGSVVSTGYYKVYIDSPEGTEVYLDGAYIGIAPCYFKKTPGYHIVTLSKEGYNPRSYTVNVDTEDKDISFSFAELTPTS